MRRNPTILVVDDTATNIRLMEAFLAPAGYDVLGASTGPEALARIAVTPPDLVLLDLLMPGMDGFEVCRAIRDCSETRVLPVIMVTASGDDQKVRAIDAGADDFVARPVNQPELLARIRSLLRVKEYHDTIQRQAAELAQLSQTLEQRVREQLEELKRMQRLRRFLSPQIAELVVAAGEEAHLASHRREITVVFCDLRGFTAFAETAEPEEVMGVLGDYHGAMGEIIFRFEGTLERFVGDGLMVFFNDPVPCADPAERATAMAVAMRERAMDLSRGWHRRGYGLGFSAGIAMGYATLGTIGFEGRLDYGAIGTVTNLASRLCSEAVDGQVVVDQRVYAIVEELIEADSLGEVQLKGFSRPTPAFNVVALRDHERWATLSAPAVAGSPPAS
jgi:class 3 adenylate cyclase/CheY-like chemotaxis protein